MRIMVKVCGELLKWMEEQRQILEKKPDEKTQICAGMIEEYRKDLWRLEQSFEKQELRSYLEIRRARYAVEEGMEQVIPVELLYSWMVENICDLEAG
ncbi:MAG: hypothetical protein KHZ72_08745 [Lachnospiraceae bacterium]|nr:hypothetical protein [Lachnospiraceae bacterium]